jgi:hypothetical protein
MTGFANVSEITRLIPPPTAGMTVAILSLEEDDMDAMRLFGFIGIVLAGGVLMAFTLEFLNTERRGTGEHSRPNVKPALQSVGALPGFFAKPQNRDHAPATPAFDDALIALLEEHVRAERVMVTGFVHFPSLDSLYRQTNPSPTLH